MNKHHCPVIHGALILNLKKENLVLQNCCLRKDPVVHLEGKIWDNAGLQPLRKFNIENDKFESGCWNCESLEQAGQESYRTGSLTKYGYKLNYVGPTRLDIMFDISCNLACRTCSPDLSTYWQKHLKNTKRRLPVIEFTEPRTEEMINHIKSLDLSELREVVFCGGETMLGRSHWRVAEVLADIIPNAKENLMLQFQTNGTIPLTERNYETIEKFHLVKFLVSADGIGDQFEYLRWPAKWDHFAENMSAMIKDAPTNVMFNLEETISIFNLFYSNRIDSWAKENFAVNRLGDQIGHCKHIAMGTYALDNLTPEYIDAIKDPVLASYVKPSYQENPGAIKQMIAEIQLEDQLRGEDWTKTFPEVAEFYQRYM
jgi:hypothetical protein